MSKWKCCQKLITQNLFRPWWRTSMAHKGRMLGVDSLSHRLVSLCLYSYDYSGDRSCHPPTFGLLSPVGFHARKLVIRVCTDTRVNNCIRVWVCQTRFIIRYASWELNPWPHSKTWFWVICFFRISTTDQITALMLLALEKAHPLEKCVTKSGKKGLATAALACPACFIFPSRLRAKNCLLS